MGNELSAGCNEVAFCAQGIADEGCVPSKDAYSGLGIICRTTETERWGTCVEIAEIVEGGPAERTGKFQEGDLLYAINGNIVLRKPLDDNLMKRFRGVDGSSTHIAVIRRATGDIISGAVTRARRQPGRRGSFGNKCSLTSMTIDQRTGSRKGRHSSLAYTPVGDQREMDESFEDSPASGCMTPSRRESVVGTPLSASVSSMASPRHESIEPLWTSPDAMRMTRPSSRRASQESRPRWT